MKTFGTHAFVNQVVVGLLVTIGFGGTVGLGTVWMRHRVSVVADANAALEHDLVEVNRRITDLSALVEQAKSEDVLRSENESMHLGLEPMTLAQINPVPVDPVARLVAKANRRVFSGESIEAGMGIQLKFDAQPAPAAAAAAQPATATRRVPHTEKTPRNPLLGLQAAPAASPNVITPAAVAAGIRFQPQFAVNP